MGATRVATTCLRGAGLESLPFCFAFRHRKYQQLEYLSDGEYWPAECVGCPAGLHGTATGAVQPKVDRIVRAWTREGADDGWGKALVSEGLSAAGSDWGARW